MSERNYITHVTEVRRWWRSDGSGGATVLSKDKPELDAYADGHIRKAREQGLVEGEMTLQTGSGKGRSYRGWWSLFEGRQLEDS